VYGIDGKTRAEGAMRQYTIDEISSDDIQKVRHYLDEHSHRSSIQDLYWLNLKPSLLRGIQLEHAGCQPYCVAIEVGDHFVKFELLIRSGVNHHCGCSRYAEPAQREFVIDFAEKLIGELGIRT
jgi:hypothetical protein